MCCNSRAALSRLAVLWGLLALVTLLVAFVSGSWLYTKEPITLPNSDVTTIITFRIGLWRVCPSIRKVNVTSIHVPSPACSLVKYSGWEEIRSTDLSVWTQLELAPVFITRMRSCTVLAGSAIVIVVLAFILTLLGQCNSDNKPLIACGLFILGALSLGTGLVVFASVLSEALIEATQYHKEPRSGPVYDYRYGWCFFAAGAAFIMTKMAAVFSLTGYLNRFPSVDEMVREMVPGAERKLIENQRLSMEFLVKHTRMPSRQQYEPMCSERPKYECECGPLLSKTPPDVCTTNKSVELATSDVGGIAPLGPGTMEHSYPSMSAATLAGQTVPIQVKGQASGLSTLQHSVPFSYSNFSVPNKYGTIAHSGATMHQGFLGVAELGSSSSNSSSGYCSKSKTLQHQRTKKKCVKIETFQVPPDAGFVDFNSKKTSSFGYSGSAV